MKNLLLSVALFCFVVTFASTEAERNYERIQGLRNALQYANDHKDIRFFGEAGASCCMKAHYYLQRTAHNQLMTNRLYDQIAERKNLSTLDMSWLSYSIILLKSFTLGCCHYPDEGCGGFYGEDRIDCCGEYKTRRLSETAFEGAIALAEKKLKALQDRQNQVQQECFVSNIIQDRE